MKTSNSGTFDDSSGVSKTSQNKTDDEIDEFLIELSNAG